MKKHNNIVMVLVMVSVLILSACSQKVVSSDILEAENPLTGTIYLYGERHGEEKILAKELELWQDYYENKGMRHLFVELPYFTGEWLNLWMQSENDEILDQIYSEWKGTADYTLSVKEFYKEIKDKYPETVFHGTDVGHQYKTTGKRFLNYLQDNGMKETDQYRLTVEAIEQGEIYYKDENNVYRENKMVENFIREFDKLEDQNVMGIYGYMHTRLNTFNHTDEVPCMATQLKDRYGEQVYIENLAYLLKVKEPERIDELEVGGKTYQASYFGKHDLTGFKNYANRKFWRLEDAYDDFKLKPKAGDGLPWSNYPMQIQTGQVFVIDYELLDGSIKRVYFRCDGDKWRGEVTTQQFIIE